MKLPKFKMNNLHLLLPLLVFLLIFATPVFFSESYNRINWSHIFKIWQENAVIVILFLVNRFFLLPHLFMKNKKLLIF